MYVQNINTYHKYTIHKQVINVIIAVLITVITYMKIIVMVKELQAVVIQVLKIQFLLHATIVQLIMFICGVIRHANH